MKIGEKNFSFGSRTYIMGILNVTPDSFSDGGEFDSVDKAVAHAKQMVADGVDVIDIGGESTRPGAKSITIEEEIIRVIPVIEELTKKVNIPLSIDTYKSEIAKKALDLGIAMVNDITALQGDKKLVNDIADYNVPIILMHMKGTPNNMQKNPAYDDVVKEIIDFLEKRIEYATFNKVKKENIIIDPGIGFGKRTGKGIEDNCEILRRLPEFKTLGHPIMIGASRKTFIGNVCGGKTLLPVTDRLEGSLAASSIAVANGADILRVHDVKQTRRCIDIVDSIIRK